ncbi:unnamed protein product, partial [Urochloa humidicola]
ASVSPFPPLASSWLVALVLLLRWLPAAGTPSQATSSCQNRRPGTIPQIRRRDSWSDAGGANPAEGQLQAARRASSRVAAVAQLDGRASASRCPRAPRRGVGRARPDDRLPHPYGVAARAP